MAARVEIVAVSRRILHPFQIIRHRHPCKLSRVRILRARIQRVRRMCQNALDSMLLTVRKKRCDIRLVDGFRLASSRVSCKKLKGIRPDGHRLFSHGKISFGR